MPTVNAYGPRKVALDPMPGARLTAHETPESTGVGLDQARARTYEQVAQVGQIGLQTGLGLYKTHLAIADEEAKRADEVAVLGAENQLANWETKRLYDPTDGALTKEGRDSYMLPETVATEYQGVAGGIAQNLGTDRQRIAFQKVLQQRGQQLDLTLRRHVFTEMRKDDAATTDANVTNSINAGIANPQDPTSVYRELDKAQATIHAYGARNGQGPEEIQQHVAAVTTKMHAGVVEQLLALEKPRLAQAWFTAHKDDIDPAERVDLARKLEVGTAAQDGLNASEAIWTQHGPKGEQDPINLDTMEAAARKQFADDPKTLDQTVRYLRERKASVDVGRREREEATSGAVWGAANAGADLKTIAGMKAFTELPGKAQAEIQDYILRRQEHKASVLEHAANLAYTQESRAYTAEQRAEVAKTKSTWARYWAIADPTVLHETSENVLQSLRGTMGDDHVNDLIVAKRRLEDPTNYKTAQIDDDLFKSVAESAGLKGYTAKSEDEKAALGRLKDVVERTIDTEQQSRKKTLTREEKETVMQRIVDQKVTLNQWWGFDPEKIAALVVTPEGKKQAYVPIAKIPALPLSQFLNYARSLPGAERMSDAELTRRFSSRIERAYGLRVLGGTLAEIQAAMQGKE